MSREKYEISTELDLTLAEAKNRVTCYNSSPPGLYTPISNVKERPIQNSELLGKHLNFGRKGKHIKLFVVTWSNFFSQNS